jgi:hypothetical protein
MARKWRRGLHPSLAGTDRLRNRATGPTIYGWIERCRGFLGSILGARKRGIDPRALKMLHGVLSSSPEIKEVRQFQRDLDKGQEGSGAFAP